MSQYPFPYQPPQVPNRPDYYAGGYPDPLVAAKRASVLMFVLGGLGLMCGGIMAAVGALITPEQISASPQGAQLHEMEAQLGLPIRTMLLFAGAMALLPGLLFLGIGFWVRRGGMGGVVSGMLLCGLTLMVLSLNIVSSLMRGGDARTLTAGLCMILVPAALCVLLLKWLAQAMRATKTVAAMRQQQQAQYWQSMQLQQGYYQGYPQPGYGPGFGAPPPPPGYGAPPMWPAAPAAPDPQQPPGPPVRHPPLPPDASRGDSGSGRSQNE